MNHKLISLFFIVLVASCNKDDDIVIDAPDGPDDPGVSAIVSPLDFSVIEYLPAPGQYINENVSGFENISSMQDACRQAEKRLAETQYVSLGAWGGSLTVRLSSSIKNSGKYDFSIAGNTFDTSNEPGIVWVMKDDNGNGLPDDQWYELKGSAFQKEGYQRDFWVTYTRPEPGENTPWTDCEGESGVINWMGSHHSQDYYYPNWVKEDSYTLHGSKLPSRAFQDPVTGLWKNDPFEWGYVDNSGEDLSTGSYKGQTVYLNNFRISDAVNTQGESVDLDCIDFIKVQTAIMGSAGILGENSTEVCGFFSVD